MTPEQVELVRKLAKVRKQLVIVSRLPSPDFLDALCNREAEFNRLYQAARIKGVPEPLLLQIAYTGHADV